MRETRRKATALLALLQLTVAVAAAQSPEVERLFPSQPTGFVNDVASVIDPAARTELEDRLVRLRSATGAEITVVTLPTIGDYDEADVALAIGRKWGVGARTEIGDERRNAGMVVLLVPRQNHEPGTGHLRIEVGQGLEGIVTDASAGQIRREVMGPLLEREEYGPALTAGVRELIGLVARGFGVTDSTLATTPRPVPVRGPTSQFTSLLPLLLFIVFIMLANRGGRRRRVYWGGGPWIGGGGWGGGGFGGGGGGFGGFGGGGGFSGGGSGGRF
ncbi:MAG TPA: TPM domain-containing protein [Gemmatimonadales bacterium]|nr:TPM domain-containing protein [Gemmatimonadales bacterium]